MGYVNKVVDNVGTHLVEPTLYAVAGGTSAAYTATISNFELVEGVTISLKIPTTNAVSATLSVNGTAAKAIYYDNAAIAAKALKANHIYNLTYDGTNWELVGDLDTNTDRLVEQGVTSTGSWRKLLLNGGNVYSAKGTTPTNRTDVTYQAANLDF